MPLKREEIWMRFRCHHTLLARATAVPRVGCEGSDVARRYRLAIGPQVGNLPHYMLIFRNCSLLQWATTTATHEPSGICIIWRKNHFAGARRFPATRCPGPVRHAAH